MARRAPYCAEYGDLFEMLLSVLDDPYTRLSLGGLPTRYDAIKERYKSGGKINGVRLQDFVEFLAVTYPEEQEALDAALALYFGLFMDSMSPTHYPLAFVVRLKLAQCVDLRA